MGYDTTFQLEFITPEQVVASKRAEMVVVPGVEGDIGVLPGHSSLITKLRPGMVCVFSDQNVEERIFVEGGIVQIESDKCVILIEKAEDQKSLHKMHIADELAKKRDEKNRLGNGSLDKQIKILEIKLELLENLPYA